MSIYRGAGGAGDAVADSSSEALLIRELAIEVQADADAATAAATAAASSESTAAIAAINAQTSETNALAAETTAVSSASSASNSATNAASSASSASSSASSASNSATAAQNAQTSAEAVLTNPDFETIVSLAEPITQIADGLVATPVLVVADGTSISINTNVADFVTQANTQATGTLTINAPTGIIVNGQRLIIRIRCTNVQTLSWNSVFDDSDDLPLPSATSGSSKYDYFGFFYNGTAAKWQLVARVMGF
jgi:hypothetical protein